MHGIVLRVMGKSIEYFALLQRLCWILLYCIEINDMSNFNPKLRILDYVTSNNNINAIIIANNNIMFSSVL